MASMFCRHNRLTANCPICRRELEAELPRAAPRTARATGAGERRPARQAVRRPAASGRLVTKRLARAADDGYRVDLAPGLKATADARRLAIALTVAAARLEWPGPYPAAAEAGDPEEAGWRVLAGVLGGDPAAAPAWDSGELPDLAPERQATAEAYRRWAERSGSPAAALAGDPSWTPQRRFARAYERLSIHGLTRHDRVELLLGLAAAGVFDLAPDSLFVEREDDAATIAAKRLLVSGDRSLLDRRARELTGACGVPFGALEHGLSLWDSAAPLPEPDALPEALVRALRLH